MRRWLMGLGLGFLLLYVLPLTSRAVWHFYDQGFETGWSRDQTSSGLLAATPRETAVIRVMAARTVRWRGIFAVHSWLVVKPADSDQFRRFDVTGWGNPVRVNGFPPDARWFGRDPEIVAALDGPAAAALIPRIEAAVASYPYDQYGDYRVWPGPNSNSFIAHVLAQVPELDARLPGLAIGKDYPVTDDWAGLTPSRTGVRLSLAGYVGLTIGWHEGVELNLFGAVAGLDLRRPALTLPGWGRLGVAATP